MKSFFVGIKDVLLWSYARGTWQYDLLCLLIIATVFLVPSRYFGDRDRTLQANGARSLASKPGASPIEIDADALSRFLEKNNRRGDLDNSPQLALQDFLRGEQQAAFEVLRYEKFTTREGREAYRVWVR
ncbi:MAG: hypothetical protein SF339_04155 [Blastocatellia bacterium]|nr:hypothetical protein [Blastocatellia bacterium]